VNFDWGTGRPSTAVPVDGFSARWSGFLVAPATGSYVLQTVSDDGVRLVLNGQTLIDQWNDHSPTTHTANSVNLVAGQRVPIRLDFYENGGGATVRLQWRTPGQASFVAVPRDRLAP
jgi:MSHA biogenesis protein MshQ